MVQEIDASVGSNGKNLKKDVKVIQRLLASCRHLLVPFRDLPISGDVDDDFIRRIELFQRRVVTELESPDGRVDPSGVTLKKLNENAKGLKASIPVFPLYRTPTHSYLNGGRQFGASRSSGQRRHAACDLKAPVGTEIRAMEDGTVIDKPRRFYQETLALEVDHGFYTARYSEIDRAAPGVGKKGIRVKKGQTIAYVGRLNSGNSMLHLELYSGVEDGRLSVPQGKFRRRSDLLNPTDFLNAASMSIQDDALDILKKASFAVVADRVDGIVNFREAPDLSANVVARLSSGDRLEILEVVENGGNYKVGTNTRTDWVRATFDGSTGFVAAYYLDAEFLRGRINDNVTTHLRMREHPQTDAFVLDILRRGTLIDILDEVEGEPFDFDGTESTSWLYAEYGGKLGYFAAPYVDIVSQGDIQDVNALLSTYEPKGASDKTASQDGLSGGPDASHEMAKTDATRVMRFKAEFIRAGVETGLPPALLAAIASRETRGGNVLPSDGWGDGGNGYGLMQVDRRFHNVDQSDGPFGYAHIQQATFILLSKLEGVEDAEPSLDASRQLQTAVSRYNGGKGKIAPNSDQGTTGGDYCNDVWARAKFYAETESWS